MGMEEASFVLYYNIKALWRQWWPDCRYNRNIKTRKQCLPLFHQIMQPHLFDWPIKFVQVLVLSGPSCITPMRWAFGATFGFCKTPRGLKRHHSCLCVSENLLELSRKHWFFIEIQGLSAVKQDFLSQYWTKKHQKQIYCVKVNKFYGI